MKKKGNALMLVSSVLGVSFVACGMVWENHPVFLVGIGLVALAYLQLRKKLKRSTSKHFE